MNNKHSKSSDLLLEAALFKLLLLKNPTHSSTALILAVSLGSSVINKSDSFLEEHFLFQFVAKKASKN